MIGGDELSSLSGKVTLPLFVKQNLLTCLARVLTLFCALFFQNVLIVEVSTWTEFIFADFASVPLSFRLFGWYLPVFFVWQCRVFLLNRILWKLEGRCRLCYLCWMNVIPKWLKLWGKQQLRQMQFTVGHDTVIVDSQLTVMVQLALLTANG